MDENDALFVMKEGSAKGEGEGEDVGEEGICVC